MTREALEDVSNLSKYMIDTFKNRKAADDFLDAYDKQVEVLGTFPIGYRRITLKQKTKHIRIKFSNKITAETQKTYHLTNKNNYNKILLQALTGISTDVRTPQRAAGW